MQVKVVELRDKAGNDAGMMNQISKDDLWME